MMQPGWNDATAPFNGALVILFLGDKLAVLQRDDKPGIDWPNHWDLPGGRRDPGETPAETALREVWEEIAIALQATDLIWARRFDTGGKLPTWVFAAHLPADRAAGMTLGDEGQQCALWAPDTFLTHPEAIPHYRERLRIYLNERA